MAIRVLFFALLITVVGMSGCTSSSQHSGQSEVREAPEDGRSAHQQAWEKGRVPEELQTSQEKLPPIEGTKTTTSTTAPTGEVETPPSTNQQGQ